LPGTGDVEKAMAAAVTTFGPSSPAAALRRVPDSKVMAELEL
jgi:hypothetical protein